MIYFKMNFCEIFFILFNCLYFFHCEEEGVVEHHSKKLNVIIFFSSLDEKCSSLQDESLGLLNLHEIARVKHSAESENAVETIPEVSSEKLKTSSNCKELLKNSLMTLTHYCHTVLKMKTAVASVSTKEQTNDIQGPDAPFHETNIGSDPDVAHKTKRSATVLKNRPMHRNTMDNSGKNQASNIITSSKHTEVFKIRVKRHHEHDGNHEEDVPVNTEHEHSHKMSKTKPSWDILDVMKHVRYSFLGKMFENTLQNQIKADQEDLVDITKLGKEKLDPGLFPLVKSTLATLLEPPESNFLMVIFGGHLHAVADKHSPIVQSIKHIIENTDSEHTLLIVTGSCTEDTDKEGSESESEGTEPDSSHHTMPVYAKGPSSDILSECSLLYDIPLTVRKILELSTGAGNLSLSNVQDDGPFICTVSHIRINSAHYMDLLKHRRHRDC